MILFRLLLMLVVVVHMATVIAIGTDKKGMMIRLTIDVIVLFALSLLTIIDLGGVL